MTSVPISSSTQTGSAGDALSSIERLRHAIRELGSVAVALSAGVDSSLVAKVAVDVLGPRAIAVTGVSASLSSADRAFIRTFTRDIGITHVEVDTKEFDNPLYRQNNPDRCFHCKDELYGAVQAVAKQRGIATVVDGTHADDLQGHRPGKRAADAWHVRSPLLDAALSKSDIRTLAAELGIKNAQKQSSPCMSSRIAYGLEVTPSRIDRVEQAEAYLTTLKLTRVRVRLHDTIARIEVDTGDFPVVVERALEIFQTLKSFGFVYVTLDLKGYRSGSLLEVLPSNVNESDRPL